MAELIDPEQPTVELSDYEYTVMITLLRIYDAIAVLLEETKGGAAKQLADIHRAGQILMPAPELNGDFDEGFSK
jgi:hypothetical protein